MFYDKFKKLCDQRGISCNKAALEMGLSNAAVPKWKKTGYTPRGETLSKIATYFDISISELLGEDIKKAPTVSGERTMSDEELKFALWGDCQDIDEKDLEDVRRYAAFVRERKKAQK